MIGAMAEPGRTGGRQSEVLQRAKGLLKRLAAGSSLAGIALHLVLRYLLHQPAKISAAPLWVGIALGGLPLLYDLV